MPLLTVLPLPEALSPSGGGEGVRLPVSRWAAALEGREPGWLGQPAQHAAGPAPPFQSFLELPQSSFFVITKLHSRLLTHPWPSTWSLALGWGLPALSAQLACSWGTLTRGRASSRVRACVRVCLRDGAAGCLLAPAHSLTDT